MAMMRVVLAVACYAMVFMTKFSCGEVAKSMAEDVHNMEDVYNNHQMALLRAFNLPEGVTVVEEEAKPVSHIRTNQGPPLPLPPGWVYGYAFSGTGCTGTRDLATGLVTEKCLAPVDSTRPLSYRITCTPASFTQISYSSVNCDPTTISGQVTTPFTCIEVGGTFSAQLQCSSLSTIDLGSEFILRQYFNDADCQAPLQFNGIRNGACLRRGQGRSVKYTYPTGTSYDTPDCTGPPGNTFTISETGNCSSEVGNYYGAQLLSFPYTSLALDDQVTA